MALSASCGTCGTSYLQALVAANDNSAVLVALGVTTVSHTATAKWYTTFVNVSFGDAPPESLEAAARPALVFEAEGGDARRRGGRRAQAALPAPVGALAVDGVPVVPMVIDDAIVALDGDAGGGVGEAARESASGGSSSDSSSSSGTSSSSSSRQPGARA